MRECALVSKQSRRATESGTALHAGVRTACVLARACMHACMPGPGVVMVGARAARHTRTRTRSLETPMRAVPNPATRACTHAATPPIAHPTTRQPTPSPRAAVSRHMPSLPVQYDAPSAAPGSFAAPSSLMVGAVTLGKSSSLWYNAIVRGGLVRACACQSANRCAESPADPDPPSKTPRCTTRPQARCSR